MEFQQTLVVGVVKAIYELISVDKLKIVGSRSRLLQGQCVPYLLNALKDFDQILHKYSIPWLCELYTMVT